MSKYQTAYKSKVFIFLLVFAVLFASIPVIVGAATGTDPNFSSGPSAIVLETGLTGTSQNDHTIPERLWVNGNTMYVAVRSTHEMTDMTIGTAVSYDFLVFADLASIFVDGEELDPLMQPELNGDKQHSHWTVFKFHTSDLVSSGTGTYPIIVTSSAVGFGHELKSSITITVPCVTATVIKTWIGGLMNPITIQLYKESTVITPKLAHGVPIPLTAVNGQATYTWNPLPYTDDYGNVLIYSIEEPSGGSGYTVDFKDKGFKADNSDSAIMGSYSWELTNTYAATGGLDLSGIKTLTGRALAAGEFDFGLYEGATLLESVSNLADGSFGFTTLEYDLDDVGDKTYTVVEETGVLGGITYATNSYTVEVTITDDGDGTLEVVVVSENADSLNFTNTYTATGSLDLSGTKTLTGRALAADEFDFELYEVEGETETLLETVNNLADGSYSFSSLDFGLADIDTTKTFRVVEKPGTLSSVTYDSTVYTLTVDISDNGDGTLAIDVTGAEPDELDFTNTYSSPPIIVVTTESIPLAEPTPKPSTIVVAPEDIPQTGESAPLWPIGLVLLALAGGLGFIVHRSDSRKSQKEKSKK